MGVETDASDIATGAVLSVKGDDGKWRPCAFLSHSFSSRDLRQGVKQLASKDF